MRSRHVDRFNHDEEAASYDADVADESHPVRAGYGALLEWVADRAGVDGAHDVLDLGAGTGNLTARLTHARTVTAVDASEEMLAVARTRCPASNVAWARADLLAFFDAPRRFDRIVSTYAIHHLEADEKRLLFEALRNALRPGGRAVLGDLMFEDARARERAIARYSLEKRDDVVEAIEDEYFWLLHEAVPVLEGLGFQVERRRFSDLSWALDCRTR
jgi:putative AdoMet-dependent methyltransferase